MWIVEALVRHLLPYECVWSPIFWFTLQTNTSPVLICENLKSCMGRDESTFTDRSQIWLHDKIYPGRARLAQMVERALWKFLPQRKVVRTPPAPGFFHMKFKYIPLRHDLESSKNATEFGHVSTSENQRVFTEWAKGEIWTNRILQASSK